MKLYEDQLIVITGGAGFIGSAVIRHLNDKGITNLVVIDDLGKGSKWKNLVSKSVVDLIPIQNCFSWLEGRESLIEAFIHLGACTNTLETDADYLLENNTRFSQKLVEYAMKHEQRFVYASTAATYGDGAEGFRDDHKGLETLKPLNMYGYSKHFFDLWLKSQGLLDRVAGLKYFNVFGPNEAHKGRMASVVVHFLSSIQKEGKVRLFKSSEPEKFADGEQKRDFIYVKDVARMTCAFLQNDACGIFNIGRGVAATWKEMTTAIFKALNRPIEIEYVSMPPDITGYQNYSCADMSKTKSVLKKQAECMPLEASVIEYIRDYLIPGKTW